jgi:1,4-alpha-glucan branching enzyme
MYGHPGKKLLFMGGEFGQWREWSESTSLDWHALEWHPHKGISRLVKDLNRLYKTESALHEVDFEPQGFTWIDFHDADNSIIAFMRHNKTGDEHIIVVCNFTPVPRHNYRVGVPESGYYAELLNSDATEYWGSGMGNLGGVQSDDKPWHGLPYSINLTLPPLSTLMFKQQAKSGKQEGK